VESWLRDPAAVRRPHFRRKAACSHGKTPSRAAQSVFADRKDVVVDQAARSHFLGKYNSKLRRPTPPGDGSRIR